MLVVVALLFIADIRAEGCRDPIVQILVSPLVNTKALRIMDLSWDVGSLWRPGDWVGLYNVKPSKEVLPKFRSYANGALGTVRTGIQEGRLFSEPDYQKLCLGWWAAYWHQNHSEPTAVSCLSSNPRWMEELQPLISSLRLNEAFIPGTHDSGAFFLAYKPFSDNRLIKYIYAQDESIMEQLIHGARYLDIRVALYKGNFWVCHGIAIVHPLEFILKDVKTFVDNTREIVILDFHEFLNGFNRSTHYKLIDFVRSEVGEHLAPPHLEWSVTLGQLWRMDKRIIAAYNDKSIVAEKAGELWLPVRQFWGNKRSIQDLFGYFRNIFSRNLRTRHMFWTAMAELTPDFWDVLMDKLNGLRVLADNTNKDITNWFRGEWDAKANGVAVDFIRSSGIVESAISWNKRKARNSMCD
nr:variant-surface-glycoprotein phospholipase C-like isoform X1 [Halyomorpha halys]